MQSLQPITSLEHDLHSNSCLLPLNFHLLCQAHCFSQLSIHRGKDLVHQDAALAALVAAGVPTLPEVDLAVAAKSTDEATVDLDLP